MTNIRTALAHASDAMEEALDMIYEGRMEEFNEEEQEFVDMTEAAIKEVDVVLDKTLPRAVELLGITAKYIREHCPDETIHYDGVDCEGSCVADDCEAIAEDLKNSSQKSN